MKREVMFVALTILGEKHGLCKEKVKELMNCSSLLLEDKWPEFDIEKWLFYNWWALKDEEILKYFTITDENIIEDMNNCFVCLYASQLEQYIPSCEIENKEEV